ncbi:Putative S-adenosyl-L-methionine-dependent methyltransferase superfamily [Colletotrichum destructivum]|uniref:S-adenosyl-L-methionine-dependent methyltransferase superfamily n=1 Tax=Colletotrichum destructivum TaxID=34406 RepID=A0AAX4I1Q6_9PEZI|nr:Putative S-adenosyl-L-methionine-dependent methyltransferase superfamily [Colletotrichum destructivum]
MNTAYEICFAANSAVGLLEVDNHEWEEGEVVTALLDRLYLGWPIESADRAVFLDVRGKSELWAVECKIVSNTYGDEKVVNIEKRVSIRVNAINLMQRLPDHKWFQQKQFSYVHIANSARLRKNRRRLIERAFRSLKPDGCLDIHDFDRKPRCDDDTCQKDDVARRLFEANMDAVIHPLHDVPQHFETTDRIEIISPKVLVHRAPTSSWCLDGQADRLIRMTERDITRGLERWCQDNMDVRLSQEMTMECVMAKASFRDQKKHFYFEYYSVRCEKKATTSSTSRKRNHYPFGRFKTNAGSRVRRSRRPRSLRSLRFLLKNPKL